MTTATDIAHKFLSLKAGAVTGQEFIGLVSTTAIDRDDEVLLPEGCRMANYVKNPILLWQHDPHMPIGTGDRAGIKATQDGIRIAYRLAKRPDWYEGEFFPDYVRALIADGVLKGLSVGFRPLEGGIRNASAKDVERFGPEVRRVINKWELLEVSVVSIPSNPDAHIAAITKQYAERRQTEAPVVAPKSVQIAPQPKRVSIVVPKVGTDDIRRMVREEVAKATGRMFA
jgi:HK97 family phage prohead protease